ncbi:MAG: chemotaxis protein CheX [Magnetococcales bacterium]|nr:chemotaxis protein CheX [Magnetococcales bacterium]
MANSEKRHKHRVLLHIKGELQLPDGSLVPVKTKNISFAGAKVEAAPVDDSWTGKFCVLRLIIQSDQEEGPSTEPHIIELQCQLIRTDDTGLGIKFIGIDLERYEAFEQLVHNSAKNPQQILDQLRRDPNLSVNPVDVRLLQEELSNFIIQAVNDIFLAFFSSKVSAGPALVKPDFTPYEPPSTEATAIVNFNGAISGGIHLSSPLHVAVRLAGALAHEEFHEMNEEACDALGELANMIAGGVQTGLNDSFEDINLTPPTIIFGSDYGMAYKSNLSSVKQYFTSESGPFLVECFFS